MNTVESSAMLRSLCDSGPQYPLFPNDSQFPLVHQQRGVNPKLFRTRDGFGQHVSQQDIIELDMGDAASCIFLARLDVVGWPVSPKWGEKCDGE